MLFGLESLVNQLPVFIAGVTALIFSIGFHEFSHVAVAYSLGDTTGKNAGRLTLNPLKHLDPVGTLLILLGAFIGWGRPAPFNPQNLRYQRYGSAFVALGGPASNLLLFTIFSLVLRLVYPLFGPENLLTVFLQIFVIMNASLLLFNLVPLPPLDGSWLLLALLPRAADPLRELLSRYGWALLLAVIFLDFGLRVPIISPFLYGGVLFLTNLVGIVPYLGTI
ncbi:MAG: site-2 protease family protein [Candidatus Kerfeldbacteria bacterium]|nr:site-2 protease family protein [Candidatus Kerfeldbacteria bacterium]